MFPCSLPPSLLVIAALASAACGRAPATRPTTYTTRDSAGIEIVDVDIDAWTDGEGWEIAETPSLQIGAVDGEEAYQLFQVVGALRLPDGGIVIASRGTLDLRFFDAEGRHIRSRGGEGDGPGEFGSLMDVRRLGDTLYAHDFMAGRLTLIDVAGEIGRTISLDQADGRPLDVWPVREGFIGVRLDLASDPGPDPAYQRRTARFRRFGPDGVDGGLIEEIPGQEVVAASRRVGNQFLSMMTTPLIAHGQQSAVVDGRLVTAITDRWELRVHAIDGTLERLIRAPSRERPVSDAEWEAVRTERLDDAEGPEERRAVQTVAELKPKPERRPAFGRFVPDRDGFLWIAPYRPEPDRPVPWVVVDPDGPILGTVSLPGGFTPTDIGADYVLGLVRDELKVPYVRLYRLTRGDG